MTATALDRLVARFTVQPNGCWQWTGHVDPEGYGRFRLDGRRIGAHRAAYILAIGPIPAGLTLDHLCRNRGCVNPDHLEPVTIGENVLRGDTPAARNAAKTACKLGHPYDDENTYQTATGRGCRTCRRRASRDYQRRRRASC